MSVEPTETPPPPPQPTTPAGPPTGYRISIFPPSALEISARLASAEQLQTLVKVLQANAGIFDGATRKDADGAALKKAS